MASLASLFTLAFLGCAQIDLSVCLLDPPAASATLAPIVDAAASCAVRQLLSFCFRQTLRVIVGGTKTFHKRGPVPSLGHAFSGSFSVIYTL